MEKFIPLLLIALLLFGCSDQPAKATPTPVKPTSPPPLIEIPSPSPAAATVAPISIKITSGPAVNLTNDSATISWSTNLESNSVIEWGSDSSYGSIVAQNVGVRSHAVNLTDLNFTTVYHYRVASCTTSSCDKSPDSNFTTGHKTCLNGMKYIIAGDFCMDTFEASVLNGKAVSIGGVVPKSLISRSDAQKACENAGKHLCTNIQFDDACNIGGNKTGPTGGTECALNGSGAVPNGVAMNCTSDVGIHDLIGNLWEWVPESVTDKTPFGSGLVNRNDILTAGQDYQLPRQENRDTMLRGDDYYYNLEVFKPSFIGEGITRGGGYGVLQAGGCYAYQVGVPLDGANNIGFRCCS